MQKPFVHYLARPFFPFSLELPRGRIWGMCVEGRLWYFSLRSYVGNTVVRPVVLFFLRPGLLPFTRTLLTSFTVILGCLPHADRFPSRVLPVPAFPGSRPSASDSCRAVASDDGCHFLPPSSVCGLRPESSVLHTVTVLLPEK